MANADCLCPHSGRAHRSTSNAPTHRNSHQRRTAGRVLQTWMQFAQRRATYHCHLVRALDADAQRVARRH